MAESDDFEQAILPAAIRADALRATGLQGLDALTGARQEALQRERGRLSGKLGPDHARVKTLSLRLEDGARRRRDLKVEIARAETVAPPISAAEWALHGHVLWKDLAPAPDMTVALVDAQGQWLRSLGYACTDARGYFRLVAKVEHAAAAPSAYVRVTDPDRKERHRGEEALPLAPGTVEYREIVLDGEGHGCVPPEGEVPVPGPSAPPAAPSPPRGKKPRPQQ